MTTHPRPKPAAFLVTLVSASSFAEHYHAHPLFSSFLVFLIAFSGFLFLRIIYRLTLHPLAKYPGPKLAAVTQWYAAYYNLIKEEGGFIFIMPELFEKYGPIVRIYPDELAVKDIASYNEAFKIGGKYIKEPMFYEHPLLGGSLLCLSDPWRARERREALGPYFSKSSIRQLQPVIHSKVSHFLQRIDEFISSPSEKTVARNPKAGSKAGQLLNLSRAYRCLTADVITKYSYDKTFGGLDADDFLPQFLKGFEGATDTVWVEYYLKTISIALIAVCRRLPKPLLKVLVPVMWHMQDLEDECREQILSLKNNPNPPPSIFDKLLHPEPKSPALTRSATFPSFSPPSPTAIPAYTNVPSDNVLTAEALLTLAAGMDTTGHTLTTATYHILRNPDKQARLLKELKTVMPTVEGAEEVPSDKLEKLPYLGAVIKETLRLTAGVPGPLPRVAPRGGTKIAGIPVPGGTAISHTHYVYHYDPKVFPNPKEFIPERWLTPTAEMNQYYMPFSRGSRQCLGMNLAYAELFSVISTVFRRYEMSLNATADEDMVWKDMYVPVTNGYLKVHVEGIRQD